MSDHTLEKVKNLDVFYMKNFLTYASLDNSLVELESVKPYLSPELQELYLQCQRQLSNFKLDETFNSAVFVGIFYIPWKVIMSLYYVGRYPQSYVKE